MVPIEDTRYGELEVLSSGFHMVKKNLEQSRWPWQIVTRFRPVKTDNGLEPLDIPADVDGFQVPFTFEEEDKIFESVIIALSTGLHSFETFLLKNISRVFQTLTIEFETL